MFNLDGKIIRAQMKAQEVKERVLEKRQKGELSVEYILIVSLVAAAIFITWKLLGNTITEKGREIVTNLKSTQTSIQ